MDTISINLSINENENNIILKIGSEAEIKIETAGDIDLSEYVKRLTFLIGKKPKLILNQLDIEDPKLQLIYKTIEDITKSFNDSINEEIEQKN
ncbi:MAG: hypothetical protein ABFD18_17590 [Syntrophomonas sp.]